MLKTIFLAARLSVKVMGYGGGWGWDDIIIIIAFVSFLPGRRK